MCEDLETRTETLYVVRLFDSFDFYWMDVSEPVPLEEAKCIYEGLTKGETQYTERTCCDYYHIFPANTVMFFSEEAGRGCRWYQHDEVNPRNI